MQGKFNSFQKTMLQWDGMHPYNAIHVARVAGVLHAERLQDSLRVGLEQCGLGNLALHQERSAYSYEGGAPTCELRILPVEQDPTPALQAEVERQLNRPFVRATGFTPFRFFALPWPATNSFFLGLVYFHAVADGESIIVLLRHLVRCYGVHGAAAAAPVLELDRYPDARGHLLRRHAGVLAQKLLALPAQIRRLRQSSRPRYRNADDLQNGFQFFAVSDERFQALIRAGKDWGLTVNDLLLALLLKCISPLADGRRGARQRRKISVGCIVNLRRELGIDSVRVFGLFLGSFIVTHPVPEAGGLRELAGDIQQQTLAIKRHRLFLATPLELGLGRFALRFFRPDRRKKFYQKNYPLWGGLTNLNLNSIWEPATTDGLLDYFRAVSTGPVTPLVLSVTTVGHQANVGVSYRTAVFSAQDVARVQDHFMQNLEQLRLSA
jgi:hypothetical protein